MSFIILLLIIKYKFNLVSQVNEVTYPSILKIKSHRSGIISKSEPHLCPPLIFMRGLVELANSIMLSSWIDCKYLLVIEISS